MCESNSHILSGPEDDSGFPHSSIGKIMFDCLKKRHPDDVITVDAITGKVFTCGQLLEGSIKFTTVLKKLAIQKGDAIAIVNENTLNYFVPFLSAFYMGIVVNALNPDYLTGELKHGLLLSKPKLIICSEKSLKTVLEVKKELDFVKSVILMGGGFENHPEISNLEGLLVATEMDVRNFTPEELNYVEDGACILLSSGTTGLPKGVLLTHQNLRSIGFGFGNPNYGNIESGDITVLVLPYFHLYAILIQLTAIAFSMKVVLIDKFNPNTFLRSIQDHRATKLFMVPPLVLFLAKSPLVDNYDLSSIKDIVCGGAPLGIDLEHEVKQRLKSLTVRQLYGLTETGGPCTLHRRQAKPGGVGVLLPGVLSKVCSNNNKALGPLEVGEICFKGPMIMKGYIGNLAATKDCFDEDGFIHTGDVGYYDENKNFYILDRMKELIKYKGFQVPPAELEALIVMHPKVRECGVIGIPDERAGQVPLAFVAKQSGAVVTEQDVVDYVASRISIQKHLYGGVVFVDDIPKNPSGKILRRKLSDLYESLH